MRTSLWPDSTATEVDQLLVRDPGTYRVLVAESADGDLIGFAEIGRREYAEGCESGPVGYLEGIWVDENVRRSGVAGDLVETALGWARDQGLREFASDCDIDNAPSREFHLAAGFEEAGRVVCFRRGVPKPG